MLPKTFCVLPFCQSMIMNDGKARLCCRSTLDMTSEGRSLSLHWATLADIWNSDHLRSVRSRMLEGKEVEDCRQCYTTEAEGGTSLRQMMNTSPLFNVAGEDNILEKAKTIVYDQDGKAPPPSSLHLWLGNLCNLKCRMCSPIFSSRIALDTVHSRWSGESTRSETLLPTYSLPSVELYLNRRRIYE
jgi:glutamate-1-semialdehyde 2,1-aminomutase